MKTLVTGAAGLVGSHLCDILIQQGHEVVGIDDLSFGNIDNAKGYRLIQDKVQNLHLYPYQYDIIYHLASMKKPIDGSLKSSSVMSENTAMIESVVNKCKQDNSYLVFTSTSDVYGNSDTFIESEPITIGPPTNERYSYAMSKLYGEQYTLNEVNQSGLNASIVRIFGCASNRSNKSWSGGHVPLFVDKASRNEDINIHGDGLQTRSIGHAIDIATGLSLIINNLIKCNGEIINLGTDEQTTVKSVAEYIVSKLNSKSKIIYTPREQVFGDYKEILVRFANTDKAKKLLGFNITYKTKNVLDEIINNV